MPVSLTLPSAPARTYSINGLASYPYQSDREPPEGRRYVPMGIAWKSSDDAPDNISLIDLRQLAPDRFSRIRGLWVDNWNSGVDVAFMFPDSGFQVVIPASKGGMFPVITQQQFFYVYAPGAVAGDRTFAEVLNFSPDPVDISRATFSENDTLKSAVLTGNSTTNIVPHGTVGTLSGVTISAGNVVGGGGAGNVIIAVQDNTGPTVLVQARVGGGAAFVFPGAMLYDRGNMEKRFTDGLDLVVTAAGTAFASGTCDVEVSWRQP